MYTKEDEREHMRYTRNRGWVRKMTKITRDSIVRMRKIIQTVERRSI